MLTTTIRPGQVPDLLSEEHSGRATTAAARQADAADPVNDGGHGQ